MEELKEETILNKKHICTFGGCNKTFSRPSRLQTHLLSHTGERPFKCDRCDKSFTRNAHLKRHAEINHEGIKAQPQVSCSECGLHFANKYSLKKHLSKSHTVKKYYCEDCDLTFNKHHTLKSHMLELHRDSYDDIIYDCDQCRKEFHNLWSLDKHKRKHKSHRCSKCDSTFNKWSDLLQHKDIVHPPLLNQLPVKCTQCEKVFRNNANLAKHSIVHSETRDVFHCPEDYCPRYFYFKRNLSSHLKSVHICSNYLCSQSGCEQKFSTKQKLIYHLETIHRDGDDDGDSRKQKPPSRPRNIRKDKGEFKKPMLSILTGVEINSSNAKHLLGGEKRVLDQMEEINKDYEQFLDNTSEAASDSEVDVGCKRKILEIQEDNFDLFGSIKRLEQNKHFKRVRLDSSESDSDFDNSSIKSNSAHVSPTIAAKSVNFSKFLINS